MLLRGETIKQVLKAQEPCPVKLLGASQQYGDIKKLRRNFFRRSFHYVLINAMQPDYRFR
jgi:hypothetical protein